MTKGFSPKPGFWLKDVTRKWQKVSPCEWEYDYNRGLPNKITMESYEEGGKTVPFYTLLVWDTIADGDQYGLTKAGAYASLREAKAAATNYN